MLVPLPPMGIRNRPARRVPGICNRVVLPRLALLVVVGVKATDYVDFAVARVVG